MPRRLSSSNCPSCFGVPFLKAAAWICLHWWKEPLFSPKSKRTPQNERWGILVGNELTSNSTVVRKVGMLVKANIDFYLFKLAPILIPISASISNILLPRSTYFETLSFPINTHPQPPSFPINFPGLSHGSLLSNRLLFQKKHHQIEENVEETKPA